MTARPRLRCTVRIIFSTCLHELISISGRAASATTSTPVHKRTGSAGILDLLSPWSSRRLSKGLTPSKATPSKIAPKASASKLAPKDRAAAAVAKAGSLRPKPSLTRKESNISAKLVRKESIASGLARKDSLVKVEDVEEEVKEAPRPESALAALNGHGRSQSQVVSSRTAARKTLNPR